MFSVCSCPNILEQFGNFRCIQSKLPFVEEEAGFSISSFLISQVDLHSPPT